MSDLVERWPGYTEQSWAERFAELDRRFSKKQDTAVKAICQLSSITSARITALETALAEARNAALEEAAKACEAERLSEPQDESDAAYDRAIDHCAQAIRALASDPLLDMPGNGKED